MFVTNIRYEFELGLDVLHFLSSKCWHESFHMESVVLFVVTSENLFFIHHEWANMMNNGG